jgi:hypothetical protein
LAKPGEGEKIRHAAATNGKPPKRNQRDETIFASCRCEAISLRLSTPFADQLLGRRDNPLVRGPVPVRACCRQAQACPGTVNELLPRGAARAPEPRPSESPSKLLFSGICSAINPAFRRPAKGLPWRW